MNAANGRLLVAQRATFILTALLMLMMAILLAVAIGSVAGRNRRLEAQQIEAARTLKTLTCILLILPQQRTPENVAACQR